MMVEKVWEFTLSIPFRILRSCIALPIQGFPLCSSLLIFPQNLQLTLFNSKLQFLRILAANSDTFGRNYHFHGEILKYLWISSCWLCQGIHLYSPPHRVMPWSTWSQRSRWCHGQQTSVWWRSVTNGKCVCVRLYFYSEMRICAHFVQTCDIVMRLVSIRHVLVSVCVCLRYLDYGNEEWKQQAMNCLKPMETWVSSWFFFFQFIVWAKQMY